MATNTSHGVWHELRVMRTKDGQSLTQLSENSGVSLSYLSDLERGRQLPSADVTRKIAMALNVPVSVLERVRRVDTNGQDTSLRELVRQIVLEELARAAA